MTINTTTEAAEGGPYTLADHRQHMLRVMATKTLDSVVTCDDLLGQADTADEKFVQMTRMFIKANPSLGLRASDLDRTVAQRKREAKARAKAEALATPQSPQDDQTSLFQWIDECFAAWGITISGQGALAHPELNAIGAFNALVVLNSERPSGLAFKEGAIRAGFERVIAARRLERLDELKQHIACDKLDIPADHALSLLSDVMRLCLADDSRFTPEEAALLFAKTVWQVKRKLHGLPVTRHTMLVLVGKQEGGKSEMVRRFARPVEELACSVDLKTLTDERVIGTFENYLGVVDELDKAERASVESLKRIITEQFMERRPMRSNATVKIPQNLTMVGTSNRDVSEAIVDETGNRRFVSLHLAPPDRELFWDAVNAFDWLDLWRAVDEKADDPTREFHAKIANVQAGERSRSNIELWLEHQRSEPGLAMWKEWRSTADLYENYRLWEERFAPRAETSFGWWSKAFARMARQGMIPFESVRRNDGNGYRFNGDETWLRRVPETAAETDQNVIKQPGKVAERGDRRGHLD